MEKEVMKSIYKFDSYADAIEHIMTRHGEIGRQIGTDDDSPAVIWHQFAHLESGVDAGPWDHEHEDTINPEVLQSDLEDILKKIGNPLFIELLKLKVEDGTLAKEYEGVQETIDRHR